MTTPPDNKNIEASMSPELTCPLNLPTVTLDIRPSKKEGAWDVYDPIRRKWVALTPEERVRQTFVNYLIKTCGFSPNRIANEVGLKLNRTSRRVDTIIYDDTLRPFVIVEYKAPSVDITPKVVEQALRYNMVFKAPFLIATNGLKQYTLYGTSPSGADLAVIKGHPTLETLKDFLDAVCRGQS